MVTRKEIIFDIGRFGPEDLDDLLADIYRAGTADKPGADLPPPNLTKTIDALRMVPTQTEILKLARYHSGDIRDFEKLKDGKRVSYLPNRYYQKSTSEEGADGVMCVLYTNFIVNKGQIILCDQGKIPLSARQSVYTIENIWRLRTDELIKLITHALNLNSENILPYFEIKG